VLGSSFVEIYSYSRELVIADCIAVFIHPTTCIVTQPPHSTPSEQRWPSRPRLDNISEGGRNQEA
jgi:hypothetical protein